MTNVPGTGVQAGGVASPRRPGSGEPVGAIAIRDVTVTYGGVPALSDVDLELSRGRVTALVGQNGSGKSTLLKTVAGAVAPEPGATLEVDGETHELPLAPDEPIRLGFGIVHQHLPLAEDASVGEHLVIGRFATRGIAIDWRHEYERAQAVLERLGIALDVRQPVRELGFEQRAFLSVAVALARAETYGAPRLIALDEVTAYLTTRGIDTIFELIQRLVGEGAAVVIVSHRIKEILTVADDVAVLRDGEVALREQRRNLTERELVEAIVGEGASSGGAAAAGAARGVDPARLEVRGLTAAGLGPLDLTVEPGEIVGVTGLLGSGYERVPYLLYSGRVAARDIWGELALGGRTIDAARLDPRVARAHGIVLVPRDRLRQAAVAQATVAENYGLPRLGTLLRGGLVLQRRQDEQARAMIERYGVVASGPRQPLGTLSGGNQQRVVLGTWLDTGPRVLLLDEPTQGVDVGGRGAIWAQIRAAAGAGLAVLVTAEAAEELVENCGRVLIVRDGVVAAELAGARLTEQAVVAHQHGVAVAGERPAPASAEVARP
jgi:ribose transport system ATP-binding protein